MCNNLHLKHKKIPPEGKAYKLVKRRSIGWVMLTCPCTHAVGVDGWIRWNNGGCPPTSMGFCLIPTLKGAIKVRKMWKEATRTTTEIVEVDYKQGLGRFEERFFIGGRRIDIMIAREFRIIREVEMER